MPEIDFSEIEEPEKFITLRFLLGMKQPERDDHLLVWFAGGPLDGLRATINSRTYEAFTCLDEEPQSLEMSQSGKLCVYPFYSSHGWWVYTRTAFEPKDELDQIHVLYEWTAEVA